MPNSILIHFFGTISSCWETRLSWDRWNVGEKCVLRRGLSWWKEPALPIISCLWLLHFLSFFLSLPKWDFFDIARVIALWSINAIWLLMSNTLFRAPPTLIVQTRWLTAPVTAWVRYSTTAARSRKSAKHSPISRNRSHKEEVNKAG